MSQASRAYSDNITETPVVNEVEALLKLLQPSMADLVSFIQKRVALMSPQKRLAFTEVLKSEVAGILSGHNEIEVKIRSILIDEAANDDVYSQAA